MITIEQQRDLLANAIEEFNNEMGVVWSKMAGDRAAGVAAIMDAQNKLYGTMVHAGLRPLAERSALDKSIFELQTPGYETRGREPWPSP